MRLVDARLRLLGGALRADMGAPILDALGTAPLRDPHATYAEGWMGWPG